MNRRDEAPRRIDQPEPGWFTMTLVRRGPRIGARIDHVDGIWRAWINGEEQLPGAADWTRAAQVPEIWTSGRMCSQAEHDDLVARAAWARAYAPDDPLANPRRPIRVTNLPPPF